MTLHEAIIEVLRSNKAPMKSRDIADAINAAKLYVRGDNGPIPSRQISARVNNYPQLFSKTNDGRIELVRFN